MKSEVHTQIDAHIIAFLCNPVTTPCHKLSPVVGSSLCPAVLSRHQFLVLSFCLFLATCCFQKQLLLCPQVTLPSLLSARLVLSEPHTLPPNWTPNDPAISWCHPSAISSMRHTLSSECLCPSSSCIATCMLLLPLVSSAVNGAIFPLDSLHVGSTNCYPL